MKAKSKSIMGTIVGKKITHMTDKVYGARIEVYVFYYTYRDDKVEGLKVGKGRTHPFLWPYEEIVIGEEYEITNKIDEQTIRERFNQMDCERE